MSLSLSSFFCRSSSRRFSIATAIVVGVLFSSQVFAETFYYEATQTVVAQKKKREQTQWQVRGWVDGDSAKVEFLESMNAMFPKGSYLLTTDGGENMTVVNPKEKTYSRWDLEALFASFGAVMQGMDGIVNLDFTDLSSETLVEEAGAEILGLATQHTQYTTSYTMKMKAMGMRRAWTVKTLQDVWATTEVDAAGMFVWLKAAPSTGDEDFDQMIKQEMIRIKGLALKVEATSTMTNKKGREQVSKSTMEVTTLRQEVVSEETFQIPSDYEEVQPAEDPSGMEGLGSIFGRKSG